MAYFILTTLTYMVLTRNRPGPIGGLKSAALAMAIAIVVGVVVEGIQGLLPERSAQLLDVGLNIAGALAGVFVVVFLSLVGIPRGLISAAIGCGMALVVVGVAASTMIWNPAYPYEGDHWHSVYTISVCGVRQPNLPGVRGGIHSHGNEYVHIHPFEEWEEGINATLSLLFKTHGGELTRDSITLPWGASFANGDKCPDGTTGELQVFADGVRMENPTTYVLRDRQTIVIMFRSVGFRDQV